MRLLVLGGVLAAACQPGVTADSGPRRARGLYGGRRSVDAAFAGMRLLVLPGGGVWLQHRDGGFSFGCFQDTYSENYSAVTGDFNGDGFIDRVVGQWGSLLFLRGREDGRVDAPRVFHVTEDIPWALTAADINADSRLDLIVGWARSVETLFGDGTGGFTEGPFAATTGTPKLLRSVDMNLDGIPDVVGIQHNRDAS